MKLAKRMGLDVPNVHFLRAPSACYLVERFDRDRSTRPASRLHTIDTMQLLNYDRSFKYQKAKANKLNKAIERTSTRALTRLSIFRWAIFNVLIGNADAHLKNLSFFVDARGYRLAPFYDLVSTVVYDTPTHRPHVRDRWPQCEMTMPLGKATHFADVDRAGVIVFATAIGLPAGGAQRQLDEFLAPLEKHVAETRREVNELARPNGGEARLLNSIASMPISEMSRALRRN